MHKKRESNIDLLRFVGLSLIILAHVSPPQTLLNIRCFDVPLMVFISGLTCYGKQINFTWKFVGHRFARLVFPVWIFLTIYFSFIFIAKSIGVNIELTTRQVFESYLLLEGIGFVWIIRVFLLIALLTPFLTLINAKIKSSFTFIALFCAMLTLYLVLTFNSVGYNVGIIRDWLYYAIGYSFIFLLGLRIKDLKIVAKGCLFVLMTIIFIALYAMDIKHLHNTTSVILHINDWKYPPSNLFLVYGIIMSVATYSLVYIVKRNKLNPFVRFVGCNSIWIYLWHIPLVQITAKLDMVWWFRYILVYLFAVIIYNIQLYAVKTIKSRKDIGFLKYLQG